MGANDDVTDRRLGAKLLGLAGSESSARRLGAQTRPVGLGLAEAASDEVSEAASAKLGTIGPHRAAHHHLSTAHASVGVGRGLAEPAAADEVSGGLRVLALFASNRLGRRV